MPQGTCKIDSCDEPARARGWCRKHWERWRKHGEPLGGGGPSRQRLPSQCVIPDCDRPAAARGWCGSHYQRWYHYGDPLAGGASRERLPEQCLIPGCTRPPNARGWCKTHWLRWKRYGDPLADRTRKRQQCSIENCDKFVEGHGFCRKHYERWRAHGDPHFTAFIRGNDEARFWSKVDKNGPVPERAPHLGPCWIWTGPTDHAGYGEITVGGTKIHASRYICGLKLGVIPDGHEPDHLCKNTGCVNYESHLEIVTQRQPGRDQRTEDPLHP
jgi:hypothetical protein